MKHALLAAVAALPMAAYAIDPIALYSFETQDAGTTPETISAVDVATFGSGGSLARNSRRLGTGSLRLRPEKVVAALPEGDDGAISSNTYTWSTDQRTIAFWMRAAAAQTDSLATMISLGNGATNGARFDIRLNTGTGTSALTPPGADGFLRLEVQGGFVECNAADFAAAGLTTLRDGTWHHIAVVVPDAVASVHSTLFYIDGALVSHSSQGTNQAINTAASPLRLGDSYQDFSRDFKGYLDDVRVFNVALTAQEVADLRQQGVTNASAIAAFDADPELLAGGQPTGLSWATTGATAISIDQGVGNVTGQSTANATPTAAGTTTYTLSVTTPAGTETAPLEVTVLGPVALTNPALGATGGFSVTATNLVPGKAYQFEMSTTMAEGTWSVLQNFSGPASTMQVLTDGVASAVDDPMMFYRVTEAATE